MKRKSDETTLANRFLYVNKRLSWYFDKLFARRLKTPWPCEKFDPNRLISHGMKVADIGGGKKPFIKKEQVQFFGIEYFGLDIDEAELKAAPVGTYSDTLVIDLTELPGAYKPNFDLIYCLNTLEHIRDADAAITAIVQMLKPGGLCYLSVPCRKAVFARLNKVLPESMKRRILHFMFPKKKGDGFPAFYDRATPAEYCGIFERQGVEVLHFSVSYWSSYFSAFFPAYIIWRLFSVFQLIFSDDYCESFRFVFRRPDLSAASGMFSS